MCLVCNDWIKGSLTNEEAFKNVLEFIDTADDNDEDAGHYLEVLEKVSEKIIEEQHKDV